MLVRTGAGRIVNTAGAETVPLAGATVTFAVPGEAMRDADTGAVSCVALTKVVGSGDPFHCTVLPLSKVVPFTVKVKPVAPAVRELGTRLVIPGGEIIVNTDGPDTYPSGTATVTLAVPAVVNRLAGTAASSR